MIKRQPLQPQDADDLNGALIMHGIALIGFIFFSGNVLGPLIVWLMKRKNSAYLDEQGKSVLNFQLTNLILFIVVFVLTRYFSLIYLLLFVIAFSSLIFTAIAGVSIHKKGHYSYPYFFPFFR